MSKHTPTPWVLNTTGDRSIVTSSGGDFAVLHTCWPGNVDEREANAAFIVLAVNSHAALVEALTALHAHLFGPTPDMPRHEIDDRCRAALALVQS